MNIARQRLMQKLRETVYWRGEYAADSAVFYEPLLSNGRLFWIDLVMMTRNNEQTLLHGIFCVDGDFAFDPLELARLSAAFDRLWVVKPIQAVCHNLAGYVGLIEIKSGKFAPVREPIQILCNSEFQVDVMKQCLTQ